MTVTYQMQGLQQLQQRLQALPRQMQTPVKAGLRAAGAVLKKEIVSTAPYDAKKPDNVHIKKNVQVGRSRSKSNANQEVFTVGIKYGKHVNKAGQTVQNEGITWYWKLVEFGTSRIQANPFIRTAFQNVHPQMLTAFEAGCTKSLVKMEQKFGITPP